MKSLFWVFVGGGTGSLLRYGLDIGLNRAGSWAFPGTLAANVLACGVLGLWMAMGKTLAPEYRWLIATGFCGGLSTFSTWAKEGYSLGQNGQLGLGILYLALSLVLGLAALWAGQWLGQRWQG